MIYNSVIQSKTQEKIPLFISGRPMHSKYNPANDNLTFQSEKTEGFFLVGGIGAGFHISNLLKTIKNSFVIAFETDKESLDFCMQFPIVQKLKQNDNVILCSANEVCNLVIQKYIPSLYGDFNFLIHRAWQNENTELCKQMESNIKSNLAKVSADYSVQSHFGKLWQRNILLNLKNFNYSQEPELSDADRIKTAAVIAAGPSLDDSMTELRHNRNSYYIIATDTTTGSLLKSDIIPDIITSVDAQYISTEHFYPLLRRNWNSTENHKPMIFLDLSASPDTVKIASDLNLKCFFIHSGHPMSSLAGESANIPFIQTGSGTVTIAACDIARTLGFSKIKLFGADFSYSRGKPYTKGTYLDARFSCNSSRLNTTEQQFASLMYRTPLQKRSDNCYTTTVLDGYRNTLEDWAKQHGYNKNADELIIKNAEKKERDNKLTFFSYKNFITKWLKDAARINDSKSMQNNAIAYTVLPFIAFLRRQERYCNANVTDLYNIAYEYVSRYNV